MKGVNKDLSEGLEEGALGKQASLTGRGMRESGEGERITSPVQQLKENRRGAAGESAINSPILSALGERNEMHLENSEKEKSRW